MDTSVAIDAHAAEGAAGDLNPTAHQRHLFLAAGQFVTERVIQNETTPTIMAVIHSFWIGDAIRYCVGGCVFARSGLTPLGCAHLPAPSVKV